MKAINVSIIEYVDDSQPGFVRFHFIDAFQKDWFFIDKVPIVSFDQALSSSSNFPLPGAIPVTVQNTYTKNGFDYAIIDTSAPIHINSEDEETIFTVFQKDLVEWFFSE